MKDDPPGGSFAQEGGARSRFLSISYFDAGLAVFVGLVLGAVGVLLLDIGAWDQVENDPWKAVDAIGSVAAATAGLLGLAAIAVAIKSLRSNAEQQRLTLLPYLRVWVGFECNLSGPSFTPPKEGLVTFSSEDIFGDEDLALLKDLSAKDEGAHTLTVWVENTQTAPLGVAYHVDLRVLLKWKHGGGIRQPAGEQTVRCRFPYIIHGQPIRLDLFRVATGVEGLEAMATALSYRDVTDARRVGATGPARFVYDAQTQEVINGHVVLGRA